MGETSNNQITHMLDSVNNLIGMGGAFGKSIAG